MASLNLAVRPLDPPVARQLSGVSLLIVGVNYWPETTGIAPYTTGFAEQLTEAGAAVTVATAVPHYPAWRVAAEYDRAGLQIETRNGVTIRRVRPNVPARMTAVSRALFEASFASRARAAVAATPVDAVIAVVPSLAGAALAAITAKRQGVPFGLIFQDLMGRSAEQSGMAGKGVGFVTSSLERRLAKAADRVGVVATGFSGFLEAAGVESSRLQHLPNWCHIRSSRNARSATRARLGWDGGETIVLHAGNMGAKQALENVVETARVAQHERPNVRFVLMGDGSRRAALQELGHGLPNLCFLDPQSAESFPDVLAAADVLLVNERATVRDMSLPSKLTSYFAAARPVVAAVRADGTTAAEIQRSGGGLVVSPEDPRALITAIDRLGNEPAHAAVLGTRGYAYAADYLGEAAAAKRSVSFVTALLGRNE